MQKKTGKVREIRQSKKVGTMHQFYLLIPFVEGTNRLFLITFPMINV